MKFTKKSKIVVIGGAGLIGSHTVDLLTNYEFKELIIFDNFTRGTNSNLINALKDKRIKIYEVGGNILDYDILSSCLKNADYVFHFAALWLLHCHQFPSSAFEVNIRGTFNVMQACVENKVKKLIYSSSASVYGDALYEPIDEKHPFNNKNFYGATKIASEAMLRSYHYRYNLNFVGLRYMNVYGTRQDYKGAYIAVIMKMLDKIDAKENIQIFGSGRESFDFICVKDCALANYKSLISNKKNNFYNVGTGKKTSLNQIANLLIKLTKSNVKIVYKKNSSATLVKNRIGSPVLAKKEINFCAKISLEKGLQELIKWRADHKAKN